MSVRGFITFEAAMMKAVKAYIALGTDNLRELKRCQRRV